ncbi:MAG: D-alanyl-D-alanine carboxypeptidase [Coriobacteriia bacterium]|nr:D-alanyl-D-alanine carboxypeptidase [Coriobacteriia bacterium]
MHKPRPSRGRGVSPVLLRISLALVLVAGSLFAAPVTALADIRPEDTVSGRTISEAYQDRPTSSAYISVPDAPDIEADYAALCAKDGTILWERNADVSVPMASTTKIMTALVALENSSPDTPMYVTYGAAYTEGSSSHLLQGDRLTLRELLLCMMVPSGNDAAVAIAENVGGTEFGFVKMMNEKAEALGMTGTQYSNASGIEDDGNYTTARDYLTLTRVAMENEIFREVVTLSTASLEIDDREEYFYSTNQLLDSMPGANGVKTGFTDEAGYCLVASAKRNSFEFYAVVFHCGDEYQRFDDARVLLEWGFAHYRTIELINSTIPVANLACPSWIDKTVSVVAEQPVSTVFFDYDGPITQEVKLIEREGSIMKGDVVGSIIWTQNREVISHVNLVATENVPEPSWWEGVKISWQRFWGGFSGTPRQATSTTSLPPTLEFEIAQVGG